MKKYTNKDDLISELRTKIEGSFIKEDIVDVDTGEIIFESQREIDTDTIHKLVEGNIEEVTYWEVKPED